MGTLGPAPPFRARVWYPQTRTLCQWEVAYYFCTHKHPPNHKKEALHLVSPAFNLFLSSPGVQPVWGWLSCESLEATGAGLLSPWLSSPSSRFEMQIQQFPRSPSHILHLPFLSIVFFIKRKPFFKTIIGLFGGHFA